MSINLRFRRQTRPGAIPGTVVVDPEAAHPAIRVISYGPDDLEEKVVDDLEVLAELVGQRTVTWVDVQGLGDAQTITRLGEIFKLHPLALEDVVNTHQRAKVEDYGQYLFIVARMIASADPIDTEQVSLFLGSNFVLTFQERPGDCMEAVRRRLRESKGRIRQVGADYLAYALLDTVVDAYFPPLEQYGESLDRLDEEISGRPAPDTIERVHQMRSDLLLLRRAIWPFREDIGELLRDPTPLIAEETRAYLRDCYDHSLQIIDLVETCREMCSDLRDYYLSAVNNRMSEIMKVLTIMATIFIPLGFIAGLYGMNFDPGASAWNMPELRWPFGYPFALALMAAVAGGQLFLLLATGLAWEALPLRTRRASVSLTPERHSTSLPHCGGEQDLLSARDTDIGGLPECPRQSRPRRQSLVRSGLQDIFNPTMPLSRCTCGPWKRLAEADAPCRCGFEWRHRSLCGACHLGGLADWPTQNRKGPGSHSQRIDCERGFLQTELTSTERAAAPARPK